jgi:hypothetical protein
MDPGYELLAKTSLEKANTITDCLENQFKLHDLCDESHNCGSDSIPNECLRKLPRRPLVQPTNLINRCIWLSHFPKSWKEAK